ncbi:unnamed protein product [Brassica oleracea]
MSISYQRLHSQSHFPFQEKQSSQSENGLKDNTIHTCEESSSFSSSPVWAPLARSSLSRFEEFRCGRLFTSRWSRSQRFERFRCNFCLFR